MIDHLVVPVQSALVDQESDRGDREGFRGRPDGELRLGIDGSRGPELADAIASGEHGLVILDDADGQTGHPTPLDSVREVSVQRLVVDRLLCANGIDAEEEDGKQERADALLHDALSELEAADGESDAG
jgi:hypothetical protein